MSTSFTYATLTTALSDMIEDSGTDFTTYLDTIIPLAEQRILRDLGMETFDVVSTTAFTASNPALTKPTGTVATKAIFYTNASNNLIPLDKRSWEFCIDYWPNTATTTATPKYYAENTTGEYHIAGTPSGTNVVKVRSIIRPTGLSSGNTTTWLSQNMGDLLFYACLIVADQWTKGDARVQMWQADYAARLAAAAVEVKSANALRGS